MEPRIMELRALSQEKIALKLKAFRKQYGYSQDMLAQRIGIKRNTLTRWENANVRISNAMLRILVSEGIL